MDWISRQQVESERPDAPAPVELPFRHEAPAYVRTGSGLDVPCGPVTGIAQEPGGGPGIICARCRTKVVRT